MKEWIEIKARGPALHSDTAAYLLLQAGSPGVVEEEPNPVDRATSSGKGKDGGVGTLLSVSPVASDSYENRVAPDTEVLLTGHLDPAMPCSPVQPCSKEKGAGDIGARMRELEQGLKRLGWTFDSATYKDRDWSKSWRYSLKPILVSSGKRAVLVRASWSKRSRRPGEIELVVDPSMAFGTGHHATTKLCLKALLKLTSGRGKRDKGDTLLDVGTGTGVLAIAAVKLGIGSAHGIEIDPVSLKIARKTVKANDVNVSLSGRVVEKHRGQYSIVVANILSCELVRLAPVLVERVASGGALLLSGILGTEADSVVAVYKGLGLKSAKRYRSGEWVALLFEKGL